ncbi:hypothetical protein G5V59_10145 [Nocardioides sp. W3-2-3]|nr:hypothetical protein [Nocardioides convexus]
MVCSSSRSRWTSLSMAVSKNVVSNAPATLTPAQIVGIYKGEITNWSQVGGTAGVIAPKIPQGGSGTRSFFVAQAEGDERWCGRHAGCFGRGGPGARRHRDQERPERGRAVLGGSCLAAG